ncbi:hypothetical protein EON63_03515 [archaeon]|nr:MAG: hypothetical protein EON63_03515 [archaeon]
MNESDSYWKEMAEKYITWFQPFTNISAGGFTDGDIRWFENGKLNACYNCVDRHLPHKADETALIWESDEAQDSTKVTYKELLQRVCKVANVLMAQGVKKGDVVTIYLPMIPEVGF